MLITEKKLQNLALQVISECPAYQPNQFQDGFIDFIVYFFEGLESITNVLFLPQNGGAQVDISYEFKNTLKYLERNRKGFTSAYWQGVATAMNISNQTLIFAFETIPKNTAA